MATLTISVTTPKFIKTAVNKGKAHLTQLESDRKAKREAIATDKLHAEAYRQLIIDQHKEELKELVCSRPATNTNKVA